MFRKTFNGVIGKIHSPISKTNEMDRYDEISYEYSDHVSTFYVSENIIKTEIDNHSRYFERNQRIVSKTNSLHL